jgi:uncharacterized protein YigA (DUF484 family)
MERQLKIAAGVLLVAVVACYTWWYWPSHEKLEAPEVLAQQALSAASLEDQERACARLVAVAGKLHKTGPRNPAREPLLQVFKESKSPTVRVAAICGLASIWDYDSMEAMFQALGDQSAEVQAAARQAIVNLMSLDPRRFPPAASAEAQQAQAKELRDRWEDFRKTPANGRSKLEAWQQRLAARDEKN